MDEELEQLKDGGAVELLSFIKKDDHIGVYYKADFKYDAFLIALMCHVLINDFVAKLEDKDQLKWLNGFYQLFDNMKGYADAYAKDTGEVFGGE